MAGGTLTGWRSRVVRRLYERNGRTVDLAKSPDGALVALKCRKVEEPSAAIRALDALTRIQPVTHAGPFVPLLEFGFDEESNTVWEILRAADDVDGAPASERADYTPATAVEWLTSRKRLSLEHAVAVGTRMTRALEALHRIGLFHHDVKTPNLFVLGGDLCLGDYDGVSSGNGPAVSEGTEGFVPLEGVVGARADFYGLGKTLYELWTGLSRLEFPSIPPALLQSGEWRTGGRRFNALLLKCCSDGGAHTISAASQMLLALEDVTNPPAANGSKARLIAWLAAPVVVMILFLLLIQRPNRPQPPDGSFLTNGLVLHLAFDGEAKDTSSHGNHGIVRGPVPAADRFGNPHGAFQFESPTQFISTTRSERPLRAMTQSVWFKSGAEGALLGFYSSPDAANDAVVPWNRGLSQNGGALGSFIFFGREHFAVSKAEPVDDRWHQAVATLSPSGVRLYRDGVLVASNAVNEVDGTQPAWWRIGRNFTGSLDDLRIYDRALSPEEVSELHRREAMPPDDAYATNGLSVHFKMNGNVLDHSGFDRFAKVSNVVSAPDRFGRPEHSVFLNGSNSVVVVTNVAGLGLGGDFSLSLWFRADSTNAPQVLAGTSDAGDITNGWHLSLQDVPSKVAMFSAAPFFNVGSPSIPQPELLKWHHAVFTYSRPSGIWRFHIDGALGSTGIRQWTIDEGRHPFVIGAQRYPVGRPFAYHFRGALDDIRIYRRALSPEEIGKLHRSSSKDD